MDDFCLYGTNSNLFGKGLFFYRLNNDKTSMTTRNLFTYKINGMIKKVYQIVGKGENTLIYFDENQAVKKMKYQIQNNINTHIYIYKSIKEIKRVEKDEEFLEMMYNPKVFIDKSNPKMSYEFIAVATKRDVSKYKILGKKVQLKIYFLIKSEQYSYKSTFCYFFKYIKSYKDFKIQVVPIKVAKHSNYYCIYVYYSKQIVKKNGIVSKLIKGHYLFNLIIKIENKKIKILKEELIKNNVVNPLVEKKYQKALFCDSTLSKFLINCEKDQMFINIFRKIGESTCEKQVAFYFPDEFNESSGIHKLFYFLHDPKNPIKIFTMFNHKNQIISINNKLGKTYFIECNKRVRSFNNFNNVNNRFGDQMDSKNKIETVGVLTERKKGILQNYYIVLNSKGDFFITDLKLKIYKNFFYRLDFNCIGGNVNIQPFSTALHKPNHLPTKFSNYSRNFQDFIIYLCWLYKKKITVFRKIPKLAFYYYFLPFFLCKKNRPDALKDGHFHIHKVDISEGKKKYFFDKIRYHWRGDVRLRMLNIPISNLLILNNKRMIITNYILNEFYIINFVFKRKNVNRNLNQNIDRYYNMHQNRTLNPEAVKIKFKIGIVKGINNTANFIDFIKVQNIFNDFQVAFIYKKVIIFSNLKKSKKNKNEHYQVVESTSGIIVNAISSYCKSNLILLINYKEKIKNNNLDNLNVYSIWVFNLKKMEFIKKVKIEKSKLKIVTKLKNRDIKIIEPVAKNEAQDNVVVKNKENDVKNIPCEENIILKLHIHLYDNNILLKYTNQKKDQHQLLAIDIYRKDQTIVEWSFNFKDINSLEILQRTYLKFAFLIHVDIPIRNFYDKNVIFYKCITESMVTKLGILKDSDYELIDRKGIRVTNKFLTTAKMQIVNLRQGYRDEFEDKYDLIFEERHILLKEKLKKKIEHVLTKYIYDNEGGVINQKNIIVYSKSWTKNTHNLFGIKFRKMVIYFIWLEKILKEKSNWNVVIDFQYFLTFLPIDYFFRIRLFGSKLQRLYEGRSNTLQDKIKYE